MLATLGARTLRSCMRISYGFLQRKESIVFKNKLTILQNSFLLHTNPGAFIKNLCTKVADSTENMQIESYNNNEDLAVENDDKIEIQKDTSHCGKVTQDSNIEDKTVLDIQNNNENSCQSEGIVLSSCSSSSNNSETSKKIDLVIKNSELDLSLNRSTNIGTNYPKGHLLKFHLPSDWKENKGISPGIKFPGDIIVIKSYNDELEHKDILEYFLKEDVLGFDTEHCPIQHLVCVVQLATQDKAVLWQCMNFKRKIPHYLKEILSGSVAKVGHACLEDAIMLVKQFNIEPENLIDTNCWARDLHCSHQSLQALCRIFLDEHLSKKHQQSNWKKANLSPGQIRYAATDAWMSLRVYQEMKRHGKELGVTLTPMYKTLQERYSEVKNNRRLKRRRRRQRLKERKQELITQSKCANLAEESNKIDNKGDIINVTTKKCEVSPRTLDRAGAETELGSEWQDKMNVTNQMMHSEEEEDNGDGKADWKLSKGSRRRRKKFLAKFHPLE